ncbi:NACHT domain-containing protein [Streptomyces sp. WI03-4A]|uniref:NACHT domain-containing protein n=1 Tax=Streptomyces sp. WI03-4A TaxID=3028706 RepID=UPI0029AF48B4|nr:NACHT domain-containing protein [Streptomyces sp. WI03-4A]MDX2591337.1 NACHT domain-containing protein [Streptomyces sp. WI03-4A]
METRRPVGWYCLGAIGGLVCVAAAFWTLRALTKGHLQYGDAAGVLSLLPGVLGTVMGVWGVRLAVVALREARTGPVIAADLATRVLTTEDAEYTQLLGGDRQARNGPIDLAFTCTDAYGVEGAAGHRTLKDIAGYYLSVRPARLVITGPPGSRSSRGRRREAGDAGAGKTVLAIALVLGLIRDRRESQPVPVRLAATAWPGTPIRDWLTHHLVRTYHLAPRDARRLVRDNLVFPVIDGLDEMDTTPTPGRTSRAARLLRAVDLHGHAGEKAPVVLTCRHVAYEALVAAEAQPQKATRVQIARIDPERIVEYLRARVGYSPRNLARWQTVLDAVTPPTSQPSARSPLARKLDSPWRLTLAAVVYEERGDDDSFLRDPADLLTLARSGDFYCHLLDRYIKAAVNAPLGGDGEQAVPRARMIRLDPQRTWRHLAALARYLNANALHPPRRVAGRELSGSDIVLHELWPLAGDRARIVAAIVTYVILLPSSITFGMFCVLLHWSFVIPCVVSTLAPFAGMMSYRRSRPEPRGLDFQQLRSRSGLVALVPAVTVGTGLGIAIGIRDGAAPGIAFGAVNAVVLGTILGSVVQRGSSSVIDPRAPVRADLTGMLIMVLGFGLLQGLASLLGFGFAGGLGVAVGAVCGVAWGLALAVAFGLIGGPGPVAIRYMAFLLCARHLPWRLGRFLDRCHQLGLLRMAGMAYQFRQRELQEHLANRPTAPIGI